MRIEHVNIHQITVTVSSFIDRFGLHRAIGYLKHREATAVSKAKQKEVDKLAADVNTSWWAENRKRFIK